MADAPGGCPWTSFRVGAGQNGSAGGGGERQVLVRRAGNAARLVRSGQPARGNSPAGFVRELPPNEYNGQGHHSSDDSSATATTG